jgi:threonine synthase
MYVAVADDQILRAMEVVARTTGIFTEPSGAAAFAGLFALVERGAIAPDERVVVINTGNGLKDISAALRATGKPSIVRPSLEAIRQTPLFRMHVGATGWPVNPS